MQLKIGMRWIIGVIFLMITICSLAFTLLTVGGEFQSQMNWIKSPAAIMILAIIVLSSIGLWVLFSGSSKSKLTVNHAVPGKDTVWISQDDIDRHLEKFGRKENGKSDLGVSQQTRAPS